MAIPDYIEIKDLQSNELEQDHTLHHKPPMESIQQQMNQQSKIMIAIYDYDPHILSPNPDIDAELSFRAGEQILIYGNMDDDGFYYGETKDGRRGLVPSNFLNSYNNEIHYLNKQNNFTNLHDYDQEKIQNHKDQSYSMDPLIRISNRTNSSQLHNNNNTNYVRNTRSEPNSDRTKLVHNTRSSSPCTQTRSYTTSNNDAVINTNINSTNYHRDELPMNDMERFPENEENPIIRKGKSNKDYDTTYMNQRDTDVTDNYIATTGPNYTQRRRSTIRSLFKRE
uniref:Peripheral-type benzodiazepine receptor-associated protein 1 n=1 Tax=Schistosoma haematobium TaxID=6185 RepID=A0A095AK36_SCHHA